MLKRALLQSKPKIKLKLRKKKIKVIADLERGLKIKAKKIRIQEDCTGGSNQDKS